MSALLRRHYFRVSVRLATPPPADFTHTDVPRIVVVPRNAQLPPLTGVVVMRAPVQAPPTMVPSGIWTLAARVPLASRELGPSPRSWLPARPARLMLRVSVPA